MSHNRKPHPLIIVHQHRDADNYSFIDAIGHAPKDNFNTCLVRRAGAGRTLTEPSYQQLIKHINLTEAKVRLELLPKKDDVYLTCNHAWYLENIQRITDAGFEWYDSAPDAFKE